MATKKVTITGKFISYMVSINAILKIFLVKNYKENIIKGIHTICIYLFTTLS